MELDQLLAQMHGAILVIDPITDESVTATSCEVRPLAVQERHNTDATSGGAALALQSITITDQALIRALYNHPSATSYGDGSYTVRG
jgi:hypothetical protein